MTVAAVICEYNPFHTGHKHQLDYIKQEINADYIICIMSGDFVQRGEPAVFSKEERTKWALKNGADAVFLLPACYSAAGADYFSLGAVTLLNKLGCVDYLCFGSESGDINRLKDCSVKLRENGTIESPAIKELMKQGNTFPKARCILFPDYEDILNSPNNVLALEYISALDRIGSTIKPVTVKREGQPYDDDSFTTSAKFLSASSVRKQILAGKISDVTDYLPYYDASVLKAISSDDFSKELYYALLLASDRLDEYLDISEDLAQRIKNNLSEYNGFNSFCETLKSKNLTHARISRALIHVLLNIRGNNSTLDMKLNLIEGIRLLGFKKSAEPLLKQISEHGALKIITKVPAVYDSLNDITKEILDEDLFASTLYDKVAGIDVHEYSKKLITM